MQITMKASDMFSEKTYKQFVRDQVAGMEIDDLIIADTGDKPVERFRSNLCLIAEELDFKFKTKTKGRKLYVGRVG